MFVYKHANKHIWKHVCLYNYRHTNRFASKH